MRAFDAFGGGAQDGALARSTKRPRRRQQVLYDPEALGALIRG